MKNWRQIVFMGLVAVAVFLAWLGLITWSVS